MRNLLLTGSAVLCSVSLLIVSLLVTSLGRIIPAQRHTVIFGCWIFGIIAVIAGILAASCWRRR